MSGSGPAPIRWAPGFEPPKEPKPWVEWLICYWYAMFVGLAAALEFAAWIRWGQWISLACAVVVFGFFLWAIKSGGRTKRTRAEVRVLQAKVAVQMAQLWAATFNTDAGPIDVFIQQIEAKMRDGQPKDPS